MNLVAKEIKDYWMSKSPYYSWDSDTLDLVSKTLSDEEVEILKKGREECFKEGTEMQERYLFIVNKAFNRHNDITCRYTTVDADGNLRITTESSITELDIRVDTLLNCNRNCIYHIKDFEKSLLPRLTLESIADLSQAIVIYNMEHAEEE